MINLVSLAPALGRLALTAGKGSLARAAIRSVETGLRIVAGAQLINQIAEWARSIGGEFDTTDEGPTEAVDGCRKVDSPNQLYFNDGSGWKPAGQGGNQALTAQALEITKTEVRDGGEAGRAYAVCTITTASYGSVEITEGDGGAADAYAIKWRIGIDNSACSDEGPGPPDDWQPMPLPPTETNGCTINTVFMGFLSNEDGTGNVQPVFRITSAVESRANGGVITGECNFQPTIMIGGGGDGKGPPRVYPDPPHPPGGDDWWGDVVRGVISGIAGGITSSVVQALLNQQDASAFTLEAPCDFDESGAPLTYTVDFPAESAQNRLLRWQVAQAYLLQQHLNWKTPICGNEKPVLEGQWVTTRWKSTEKMAHSRRRLRKLFRYRTKSTRDLGQLSAYWEAFTWEAGDVCVFHKGAWWGTPQVWAASQEEGQRVIRFAAAEAGIDPDQNGEWGISSSRSPRYGMSGTMTIEMHEGFPWVSSRQGPSFPNTLALMQDP